MEPNNVQTIFIYGQEQLNKILLFKFAIDWSENGSNVLYISNAPISTIPDKLRERLVKDTLKRIIFMYFDNTSSLLSQCAEFNKSSFIPQVIIIDVLDQFCKLHEGEPKFNMQQAAFVCAALLSSMTTCAQRLQKNCYLIVACNDMCNNAEYLKRLKLIIDLYFFKHVWHINNENDLTNIIESVSKLRDSNTSRTI